MRFYEISNIIALRNTNYTNVRMTNNKSYGEFEMTSDLLLQVNKLVPFVFRKEIRKLVKISIS